MSFLDLCSNTIIIGFAFTLLVSGIIVYLMNTKISRVEKNIQKQNQALAEAVNTIKAELNNIPMLPPPFMNGGMCAVPNMQASDDQTNAEDHTENMKIEVSDDSESCSSDSDSDSVSDDESDVENLETQTAVVPSPESLKTISLTVVSDSTIQPNQFSSEALEPSSRVVELNSSDSDSVSDDSSDDEDNEETKEVESSTVETEEQVDTNSITEVELNKELDKVSEKIDVEDLSVSAAKTTDDKPSTQAVPGLTKMKVTELKDLAVDKNLASPNTVADMKKKDLLELLRNQ